MDYLYCHPAVVIAMGFAMAPNAVAVGEGAAGRLSREKGLEKSRGRLPLADEREVLERYGRARDALAAFREAMAFCEEIDGVEKALKPCEQERLSTRYRMDRLQITIDQLDRSRGRRRSMTSANAATLGEANQAMDEMRSYLTDLRMSIDELNGRHVGPQKAQQASNELAGRRARLVSEADSLKDAVEPVQARYRQLERDPELKKAVEGLKADGQGTLRFRSAEFETILRELGPMLKPPAFKQARR
ncbi:MAG: hypothetical protein U0800_14225 [Isosphaeraceae bacterium]